MSNDEAVLPSWLTAPSAPSPASSARRSNRWAERTVTELAGAAREMATAERWARSDGVLQRRDARAKWLSALGFLVTVAVLHHPTMLAAACVLPPALAVVSGVPPVLLLRRAGTALFFFGFAVALPTLLLTHDGGISGVRLILRIAASLPVALLLVLTTRWRDLIAGLRGLGVPVLFVAVLEATYRHLFVLPVVAEEMFQARRARTVGVVRTGDARRFVGFSVGALLGKSHAFAEATHDALLARGYAPGGESDTAKRLWKAGDFLLLIATVALAALLMLGDHALG